MCGRPLRGCLIREIGKLYGCKYSCSVKSENANTVGRPECMEKGRHMMVWVWSFGGKARFSTCFDVMIK